MSCLYGNLGEVVGILSFSVGLLSAYALYVERVKTEKNSKIKFIAFLIFQNHVFEN